MRVVFFFKWAEFFLTNSGFRQNEVFQMLPIVLAGEPAGWSYGTEDQYIRETPHLERWSNGTVMDED